MKLSKSQQDCLDAVKRNGSIRVVFWGHSVHSMSVRGNIRTLNAMVRKGVLKVRRVDANKKEYSLAGEA